MTRVGWLPFSLVGLTITLMACEGPAGPQGEKGDPGSGSEGPAGQDGADGTNGTDGTDGVDGQDGKDGLNGLDGADGADGQDGVDGQDGQDGLDGQPGVDGQDGQDGQDGMDGADGMDGHDGAAPWGMNLEVISFSGGTGPDGQFQVGDIPVITFSVTDDAGTPYDVGDLTGLNFQVAGPIDHYQIIEYYSDLSDTRTASVYNGDGTWTYTFLTAIPSTYHAVPNDTTDLGVDDGDWGGEPIQDGTYTLAAWAYLRIYRDDGTYWYDADNYTQDVLVGAATTYDTREVTVDENCAGCHGDEFYAHGGSRRDVKVCQVCHVAGGEDRYSATDSTTTPGATIAWMPMIHKIHAGEELTNGYVANGYPGDSTLPGYPNYNEHDYSEVVFPSWPMGPAACFQCHGGAADEANIEVPSREACGTCHDAIDWVTGDGHDGGLATDDAGCTLCHKDGGFAASVEEAHMDIREDSSFNEGLNVEILSAVDQTGDTVFNPGDTITITYTVKDDAGNNLSNTLWEYNASSSTCGVISGRGNTVFTGPTTHMEKLYYSYNPSTTVTTGSMWYDSTYDSTTGVYTYTLGEKDGTDYVIPSTFQSYQYDGSTSLQLDGSDGDMYGMTIPDGTYRIGVDIYTNKWNDSTCTDTTRQRIADSTYVDVLFGAATELEPRTTIDESGCENCHNVIEFHGSGRIGVNYCMMCHTAGSGDFDLPVMIHKIHGSGQFGGLDVEGEEYDIDFPRQDGGVMACTACHGDNTEWMNPGTRGCVTCHDTDDVKAHAALNTDATYGESCNVCHGEGRDYNAEEVHNWLR